MQINSWCDLAVREFEELTHFTRIQFRNLFWLTRWDCDEIKAREDIWWALLTCNSWHGPPRGWGLHTGSERCYKNSLAQRIPSLHLNIKWKNNVVRIGHIVTARGEILLCLILPGFLYSVYPRRMKTMPKAIRAAHQVSRNMMTTQQTAPSNDNHLLYNLKDGRQPGDTHISTCLHTLKTLHLIDLCPLTWRVGNWGMKATEVD